MRPDYSHLILTSANGIAVLSALLQLAGLAICLFHRHLSRWMRLMMVGFGGLFVAGMVNRSSHFLRILVVDYIYLTFLIGAILHFIFMVVLISGLAAVLADIRRRLSSVKGPDDDLR